LPYPPPPRSPLFPYTTLFRSYRLMDITVVINKGLAYSLLLCVIFIPSYLAVAVSHRATPYSIPPLLAGTIIFASGLWTVFKNPRSEERRVGRVCGCGCCAMT